MKRLGRLFFYLLAGLLWALVLASGLEGWTRWQWQRLAVHNPFILSRTQDQLWPIPRIPENDFSEYLSDGAFRDQYRGQGKSTTPLALPTPEEEMLWRFPAFLAQDDFGRFVFSNVYGVNMLAIDQGGKVLKAHATADLKADYGLDKCIHEADAPSLISAIQSLAEGPEDHRFLPSANPEHKGPFGYCVFGPDAADTNPETRAAYWLAYPRAESWQPPETDTIWELPFLTYRKHAERKDRINALGITEDFYINNFGFRDADLIKPKPAGTFRILCVGASTTEEGPVNDLTYPAILEMLLNKEFGFKRIDVVNCGISGMNSLKHRMRIADYMALEPDLIVLYNAVNDICHDLFPLWLKDASPFQKYLRESRFVCRYFGRYLLPDEVRLRSDIVNNKISNLSFIGRYAADHGVPVAVCSFAAPSPDALSRVERDYYEYYTVLEWTGRYSNFDSYLYVLSLYNDALRQLCDDEGYLYIPVEENMRDGVIMFGDICHLRNPGIEKKAGIIAANLLPHIRKALGQ